MMSHDDIFRQWDEEREQANRERKAKETRDREAHDQHIRTMKAIREREDAEMEREMRSQTRNIEYECSYQELLDAVEKGFPEYTQQPSPEISTPNRYYYYTIDSLPAYYFYLDTLDERLGYGRFSIEKLCSVELREYQHLLESLPKLANGASIYKSIGFITVKSIIDRGGSTLGVKTDNPDLLEFFSELLAKIEAPRKEAHLPVDEQKPEPWKLSRPEKRKRDKIIWEMREDSATWETIANEIESQNLGSGVNTVKENYKRMKAQVEKTNTR